MKRYESLPPSRRSHPWRISCRAVRRYQAELAPPAAPLAVFRIVFSRLRRRACACSALIRSFVLFRLRCPGHRFGTTGLEGLMTERDLPELAQNPVKDPDDWTTGDEPMTGPQASYLTTLLQQAGRPESDLDPALTKADASKLIDELQKETGRGTASPS